MSIGKGHAIGIDLGGGTVRTGLYTAEWDLLELVSCETRVGDGPEAVIEDMAMSVRSLCSKFSFTPGAIGLGSPGPLDLIQGELLQLPNFPGWENFPIRDALAEAVGTRVVLESDGNAAALAEWREGVGALHPVDSMCMYTLGTGLGSGLILHGRVWHGRNGMGGELGHVSLIPDGLVWPCGSRGCLERYASSTAISAAGRSWLRAHEPDHEATDAGAPLTTKRIAEMANQGHEGMKKLFALAGYTLGLSIENVVNTLDLPPVRDRWRRGICSRRLSTTLSGSIATCIG